MHIRTLSPPTTESLIWSKSPVCIGIASDIASFTAGSPSEAAWFSADSHTSVTQVTSGTSKA